MNTHYVTGMVPDSVARHIAKVYYPLKLKTIMSCQHMHGEKGWELQPAFHNICLCNLNQCRHKNERLSITAQLLVIIMIPWSRA